ncbi:ATP-binding cassette domain-containing protein [Nonomuraea polychroma]|uniref:ATP-binding cassette domain-containing protein n=1 Tax=Nonomuraea polychroma TaxID=46176 RepID=UPI003D902226
MIEVRDLRVSYGGRVVADVPELDVGEGECVAIVGESGSGKSTTLLSLLGLTPDAEISGQIKVCGVDVLTAPPRRLREIRGAKAALVMQSPQAALSPATRLGVLMRRALRLHGRDATEQVMAEAMEAVLLDPELLRRYPHEVSGGQAQRFAIALAIALGAEVILADEPTSALDVTVQAEVVGVLRRLRAERGLALLLVSHDLALVSTIADRVLVMKDGAVVESGPAADVLAAPSHPYTRELLEALP